MGQDIRIWLFDDLEGRDGGVEATHVKIALAFDDWTGTIDLGDKNYERLARFLEPYLAVGAGKRKPPRQRGRRPNAYYVALRAWLKDTHGIELQPDDGGKYVYPDDLRAQFDKIYQEVRTDGVG